MAVNSLTAKQLTESTVVERAVRKFNANKLTSRNSLYQEPLCTLCQLLVPGGKPALALLFFVCMMHIGMQCSQSRESLDQT